MTFDPTVIDLVAHQVLNCVCEALDTTATLVEAQPGCPCRMAVTTGVPMLVICGADCKEPERQGQLYVSVMRTFRTTNFPIPNQTIDVCEPATMALEILVTLVRCAPMMDSQGNPPLADALTAAATITNTDMYTVISAILCCLPDDPRRPTKKRRVAIIGQLAKEPGGSVAGSETRFVIDLNDPCGCPPDEES